MKTQRFTIIVEKDEDGYFAYCPQLQGCYTQGDTYEEVMKNIEEVIELHLGENDKEKQYVKVKNEVHLKRLIGLT